MLTKMLTFKKKKLDSLKDSMIHLTSLLKKALRNAYEECISN